MQSQVWISIWISTAGGTLAVPGLGRFGFAAADLLKPADNVEHLRASLRQAWQIGRGMSVQADELKHLINVRLGGLETGTGRYFLIGSVHAANDTYTLSFSTSLGGAALGGRGTGSDGRPLNNVVVPGISMAYLRKNPSADERLAQLRRNIAACARIAKVPGLNSATAALLTKATYWI